jgi:predicted ABC-type ATPase
MWLVAGPNGSGKSTFTADATVALLQGRPSNIFNADDLSRSLREADPSLTITDADLRAVRIIDERVAQSIEERETFLVETVLSTDKYKAAVLRAKELGYCVGLVFVTLQSPELNVERVALRVRRGGHGVPPEKVIKRWGQSLRNLAWFAERAEVVRVYDNTKLYDKQRDSSDGGELIAEKREDGTLRLLKPGINLRVDSEQEPLLAR